MNERNDLLLEIGVEELPTSLISSIFEQLSNTFLRTFSDARLGYDTFQVWGSPRRMVIFLSGLQNQQEPIVTEVKGPARKTGFSEKGEFLRPALAFAGSQKIQPSDLFVKETDRGAYIFGRRKEEGKPTGDVLPFLLSETIRSLSFPRSMLWGEGDFRFIRPIRWIVALYGEKVIPFSCAGVQSSNLSRGHRFFSSKLIEIHDPSHYSSLLEQAMVIVDPVRRRTMIESALDREAKTINGHWLKNEDLIAEVTFLVEYPDAKVGNFHQKYLSLPPRVLTMVMKHHQKYFACVNDQGSLLPNFLVVLNRPSTGCEKIIHGNERVLRARLEDALFFFAEDQEKSLENRIIDLKGIVFQEGLGTMWEKTMRLKALVTLLGQHLPYDTGKIASLQRAALLSKTDLTCEMVKELPELQGYMGKVYALLNGEPEEVATAIEDQYLPSPGQENYPETFTGCVLALIDKLDNMVSSFALGRISTGSEDPLGLRRQAQGFISILLNRRWYLSLREGIMWNLRILEEQGFMQYDSTLIEAIIQFLLNRFRFSLLESGYNYSVINAVLAVPTDDIYEVFLKVNALQKLLTEKKAFMEDIIVGYTRAKNITKNHDGDRPIDENLFIDEAERNLFLEVNQVEKEFFPAVKRGNYMEASETFSLLLPSLHSFFEKVLVMCESEPVRTNRLSLVKKVVSFWSNVADLSQIVVQEEHR